MKHSAARSLELLAKHHDRRVADDGVRIVYPPKTPEAALWWKHTGVCPGCSRRSVSCSRCAECGWRATS